MTGQTPLQVTQTPVAPAAVLYLRVSTREQAQVGGEAEGYSIPAQRQACLRRAEQLGAVVIEEFVDAGASARSTDRPELQRLLTYLSAHPLSYVIVHKVDRLARSRVDDVAINLAIQQAGAQLISCSENIDETPSGMLLHGIMSSIAEFYSRNLANEVIKGTQQKVTAGGTPYKAPIGYMNVRTASNGIESRTVMTDPERSSLIKWAFEAYATGDWSLSRLAVELEARGLTQRPTATRPARPLPANKLNEVLKNRYYLGFVSWRGVEYQGKHEPLVSGVLFEQVQRVLSSHQHSGERSYKHHHYLTGSIFCDRCDSRLLYGVSRSRNGNTYEYFFCAGRHSGRTSCELPWLPEVVVERAIERQWHAEVMKSAYADQLERDWIEELSDAASTMAATAGEIERRIHKVQRERLKWAELAMDGSVPGDIAREKQQTLALQLESAESELASLRIGQKDYRALVTAGLALLRVCGETYAKSTPLGRRDFNLAWFEGLYIDDVGDGEGAVVKSVERTSVIAAMQRENEAVTSNDVTRTRRHPGEDHRGVTDVVVPNVERLVPPAGFEPALRRF